MQSSRALPSSGLQQFINRVANADLGSVITGPSGTKVRKINYSTLQLNVPGDPALYEVSNEDYFQSLQRLEGVNWDEVGKTDLSTAPANTNGVENLIE